MASKSETAPKGRATRAQGDSAGRASFLSPTMQWVLVTIVGCVIIAGIFYFGRDVTSNLGGGHSGAPAPAEVIEQRTDLDALAG